MADNADRADNDTEIYLAAQIAAARTGVGAFEDECIDCGSEIPQARRLALAGQGCVRCTSCQTLADRRRLLHG